MPNKMIVENLTSMCNQLIYHNIRGEYKEYVQLRKKFAKQFIAFPNEAQYIPNRRINLSLFSREGMNILKIWFRELFRKKTPDEVAMKQLNQYITHKNFSGLIA